MAVSDSSPAARLRSLLPAAASRLRGPGLRGTLALLGIVGLAVVPGCNTDPPAGAGADVDDRGPGVLRQAVAPSSPVVWARRWTSNPKPTWYWKSGGGGTGDFRFKLDDNDLSGAAETRVTEYTPDANQGAGSHTLYIQERNDANEWSATASLAIIVAAAPSPLPPAENLGRINRTAAGYGEYVWLDAADDQRTDRAGHVRADILELRVTADPEELHFTLKMQNIDQTSGNGAPQIQIAIDRDHTSGSGRDEHKQGAETLTTDLARWERLIVTRFGLNAAIPRPFVFDGDNDVNASGDAREKITGGVGGLIEITVPWSQLGGVPATTGGYANLPLWFTVSSYFANAEDGVWDTNGGATSSNAFDVVSNFGDPGLDDPSNTSNTWAEVGADRRIDYDFAVWFQLDAEIEPSSPLLLQKLMPQPAAGPEWVRLLNRSGAAYDLTGVRLTDEETVDGDDGDDGANLLPSGTVANGATATIAADGAAYDTQFGALPDYEIAGGTAAVDLTGYAAWTAGNLALGDAGDELLLLDARDTILDVVVYGTGAYAGITKFATAPVAGEFLRRPGSTDTDDCAADFATGLHVTVEQAAGQADPGGASVRFTVTFSQPVDDFVAGDVSLGGSASPQQVAVSGSGTTYELTVTGMTGDGTVSASLAAGVAKDSQGNPNLASTSTDNSVTVEVTPPTVASFVPDDGASEVGSNANLVVTFDENVSLGSGNILIKLASDDSTFETIPVGGGLVTINGAAATINPAGTFSSGVAYYVTIAATCFVDGSGNAFAGIADETTWNFTSEVTPVAALANPPAALSSSTSLDVTVIDVVAYKYKLDNGAYGAETPIAQHIELADLAQGQHTLSIIGKNANGTWQPEGAATTYSWTVDSIAPTATLTNPPSNPSKLRTTNITVGPAEVTHYKWRLDGGAWSAELAVATHIQLAGLTDDSHTLDVIGRDATGNWQADTSPTSLTWLVDATAPTVQSLVPVDNATGVLSNANLVVTFSENVSKGSGNLVLYRSNDTLVETISVASGLVTVAGATVTINPAGTFASGIAYYVQIAPTCFVDSAGNNFAGIADETSWSFTANAAPLITPTGTPLAYVENATTAVDSGVDLTDAGNITTASIRISSGYVNGQDVLAFANANGISGAFNAGNGTMTLTGPASAASFQAALRAVTYQNTSDAPSTGDRVVTFEATDGDMAATAKTRTITIGAVNDAPVNTVPGALSVAEDTNLTLPGIHTADADVGGSSLRFTLTAQHGKVTLASVAGLTLVSGGNGSAAMTYSGLLGAVNTALTNPIYRGDQDFNGADSIELKVEDLGSTGSGGAKTDTDTIAITVTPVNDPPTASNSTLTTLEDSSAGGTLQGGDVDTGDTLTYSIVANGSKGTATITNAATGAYTYVPDADANGADTFTFRINDGTVNSNTAQVSVTITPVNDVPSFTMGPNQTFNEDSGLHSVNWATVLVSGPANESGQTLNFIVSNTNAALFSAQPAISNTGVLTFTGAADKFGTSTVTVQIHDNGGTDNAGVDTSVAQTFTITINNVNDAPTVVASAPVTTYVEGGSDVVLDNGLVVGDIDSTNLTQATITFTAGYQTPEDVLLFTNQSGISGAYANGVMTLSGSATLAQYQTALRSVTYRNTKQNPKNNDRTLTFLVRDADGLQSSPSTKTLRVTEVNDIPTITTSAGALAVTENDGAAAIDPALTVADVDSVTLASATIQITGNYANGQDVLAFTAANGVTVTSWTAATGTLVLGGAVAPEVWEAALQAVTYRNTSDFPSTAVRTVSFIVHDGIAPSLAATKTITVAAVNDPPVNGMPAAKSVAEDTNLSVTGLSVSDPDLGTANLQLELSVSHGVLTVGTAVAGGVAAVDVAQNGTSSVTITSTLAKITATLANASGLTYRGDQHWNGAETLVVVSDDLGSSGGGGAKTDTDNLAITVSAVNDPPQNTVPGGQTVAEEAELTFAGNLGVADLDVAEGNAGNTLQVTLTVLHGILTLDGLDGLVVDAGANGSRTVTVSGTPASLNAALDGLKYRGDVDYNTATDGVETLTILTSDGGKVGSGGAKTDTDTVDINVTRVNDAPVNTVPGARTVNEDTDLTFAGNLSVGDADVDETGAGNTMTVTLTVLHGKVTLSQTAGLTFGGGANGTATVTFTGTPASVNAALNNMKYRGAQDYNGAADGPETLTIVTSDLGNSGGGALSDTDTVGITVSAVNDDPIVAVPAAQSVDEDTDLVFAGALAPSVSDADVAELDAGHTMKITLGVVHGVLTLSRTDGLTFDAGAGDGTADRTMTFRGTPANLNAALLGLKYRADEHYNTLTGGAETLTLTVDDLGNVGAGGAKTDTGTVVITVNRVNDAPVNTVPVAQSVAEDTDLTFAGANAITVADLDVAEGAATNKLQVKLTVLHGTVTLSQTTGLTTDAGANGSATVTVSGTPANLNAALAGMKYRGTLHYNTPTGGAETLTVLTSDLGNTGSGGAKTDSDTVGITVSRVNDAPLNTVPTARTIAEDTDLTFAGNLSVADPDVAEGTDQLRLTLSVLHGTLTLSQTTGLTINPGANGSASLTATGTPANLNAALNGMKYRGDLHYNSAADGAETLTVVTNDQGNTGGAALSDTDTVGITVTAVNDPPEVVVPAAQTVAEDLELTFSAANGLSVSDLDVAELDANHALKLTLSVVHGTLTLSRITGLTFSTGDGTADRTMVFTGTPANINAALDGMKYRGDLHYNTATAGAELLTMTVDDQAFVGTGGALTDSGTVAIDVTRVNDAPVATVPGAQTVNEDTDLVFSGALPNLISVADVDLAEGDVGHQMKVTLTVVKGVLSLNGVAGLTFSVGDGTADRTMTFTGTAASINTALSGMRYRGDEHYNSLTGGAETLQIALDDQGFLGAGGALTDSETVAITVNRVNDAPVNTVPGAQTVDEDTDLVFSGANLPSVFDLDVAEAGGGSKLLVTLTVVNGTLTLGGTANLTFTTGDGTADKTLVFSGTPASINTALTGMRYRGDLHYNTAAAGARGPEVLTLTVNDQGNTGSGGAKSDTDTVAITVVGVNDAPVNTVPAQQTVAEEADLTFSAGTNLISVADLDVAEVNPANKLQVKLTVLHGILTLSGTTGLTPIAGGNGSKTMTYQGTPAQLNAALAGMKYKGDLNFNTETGPTPETLTIETDDLGNVGQVLTRLVDTDTVNIVVTRLNDAPVATVPGAQTVNEETDLVFNATGGPGGSSNLISVFDLDVNEQPLAGGGNNVLKVTLDLGAAGRGILTLGSIAGLTIEPANPNGSKKVVFSGTPANVNAALNGLRYRGNLNYNHEDANVDEVLTVTVDDLGNTGVGGAKTDTATVAITVRQVNDAPVVAAIANQTISEASTLTFAVPFTDPDLFVLRASGTAETHSCTVLWGDGKSDTLPVQANARTLNVSHIYTDNQFGGYVATVKITDRGGLNHSVNVNVTVNNVAPIPEAGGFNLRAVLGGAGYPYEDPNAPVPTIDAVTGAQTIPEGYISGGSCKPTPVNILAGGRDVGTEDQAHGFYFRWTMGDTEVPQKPYYTKAPSQADASAESPALFWWNAAAPSGGAWVSTNAWDNTKTLFFFSPNGQGLPWVLRRETHTYLDDIQETVPANPAQIGPIVLQAGQPKVVSPYTITLETGDKDGALTQDTFTVTVQNVAPLATPGIRTTDALGNPVLNLGQQRGDGVIVFGVDVARDVVLSAENSCDPGWVDNRHLKYFWTFADQSSTDPSSKTFTRQWALPGTKTGTLRVEDPQGLSTTKNIEVVVSANCNIVASINPVPGVLQEGTQLQLTGTVSANVDPARAYTYSWNFGDGSSYVCNTAAGQPASCVASHTYADNGNYTVGLTISDDLICQRSTSRQLTLNNVAPVLVAGQPHVVTANVVEGVPFQVGVSYTDKGSFDTHTVAYDCNNDGTFEQDSPTGVGTCTYTADDFPANDDAAHEKHTVGVRVRDNDGDEVTGTVNVTVKNGPPTAITPAQVIALEGTPVSLGATANDLGTDPGDAQFAYAWSFGAGYTSALQNPTFTFPDDGSYPGEVVARDNNGGANAVASSPAATTVIVQNVPPTAMACLDSSQEPLESCAAMAAPDLANRWQSAAPNPNAPPAWCQRAVGRATAPVLSCVRLVALAADLGVTDVSNLRFGWKFGDGESIPMAGPGQNWWVSHIWDSKGTYDVELTVDDPQNGRYTDRFKVEVTVAPPRCDEVVIDTNADLQILENKPVECSQLTAMVEASTPSGGPLTYHFDWGNGVTMDVEDSDLAYVYPDDGAEFLLPDGSHLPGDAYTLQVTVEDESEQTALCPPVQIKVANSVPRVSLDAIATEREGTSLGLTATASDCDTDLTYVWNFGDGTAEVQGAASSVEHVFPEPGNFTVTVRAEDESHQAGATNVAQAPVTVLNAAPTVAPTTAQVGGNEGDCLQFAACATDPGGQPATPIRMTWKWPDGSSPAVDDGVTAPVGNCAIPAGASNACLQCPAGSQCSRIFHAFPDNSTYSVQVEALDPQGELGSTTVNAPIVNVAPQPSCAAVTCTAEVGVRTTCNFTAVEPGTDDRSSLRWELTGQRRDDQAIAVGTGVFTWTPSQAYPNGVAVNVKVTDKDGGFGVCSKSITVTTGDSDHDLIPDSYEALAGPRVCLVVGRNDNVAPHLDEDGDGLTNYQEYSRDNTAAHSNPCRSNLPTVPAIQSPLTGSEANDASPMLSTGKATDPDQNFNTSYLASLRDVLPLHYLFVVRWVPAEGVDPVVVASNAPPQSDPDQLVAQTSCDDLLQGSAGALPIQWAVPAAALAANCDGSCENQYLTWQVRACDDWGFGPWSVAQRILYNAVSEAPATPALVSPEDGAENQPASPQFVAQPGSPEDADFDAVRYTCRVWYQDGGSAAEPVSTGRNIAKQEDGTVRWTPPQALPEDTWYCWDCLAVDSHDVASAPPAPVCFLVNTANTEPACAELTTDNWGQGCGRHRRPGVNVPEETRTDGITLGWRKEDAIDPDGNPVVCSVLVAPHAEWDAGAPGWANAQQIGPVDCQAGSVTVNGLSDNTFYYWTVITLEENFPEVSCADPRLGMFFVNTANDRPAAPQVREVTSPDATPDLAIGCAADSDLDLLTYACEVRIGDENGPLASSIANLAEAALPANAQCPSNWECAATWSLAQPLVNNQDYCFRCRACDLTSGCATDEQFSPWSTCQPFRPVGNVCPQPVSKVTAPEDRSFYGWDAWPTFEIENVENPDANAPLRYRVEVFDSPLVEEGTEPALFVEADEGADGKTSLTFSADQTADLVGQGETKTFFWRVAVHDPVLDPEAKCPTAVSRLWRFSITGVPKPPDAGDSGCCGHLASSEPPYTGGVALLTALVGLGLVVTRRRRR